MNPYLKAIVGALSALLVVLQNVWPTSPKVQAITAVIGAVLVYLVPNGPAVSRETPPAGGPPAAAR